MPEEVLHILRKLQHHHPLDAEGAPLDVDVVDLVHDLLAGWHEGYQYGLYLSQSHPPSSSPPPIGCMDHPQWSPRPLNQITVLVSGEQFRSEKREQYEKSETRDYLWLCWYCRTRTVL